jgi:hypothetical protein
MRILQNFRYWVLFTLVLMIIVPGWTWLGDFLGYDVLPAPDPAPPRYSNGLLGLCFYIVLFALPLLILLWFYWSIAIFNSWLSKRK